MPHAAVGGDDARAGELRVETRRADEIAAEKDDEKAHGVALITHAGESGRRRARRKCPLASRGGAGLCLYTL